jgi:hypothetical protein
MELEFQAQDLWMIVKGKSLCPNVENMIAYLAKKIKSFAIYFTSYQ